MKRSCVIAVVSATFLVATSAASAATICVPPATGCTQSAGTITEAFTQAKSNGGSNTIDLGAGTYSENNLVWDGTGQLTITGAGTGATTIQRATTADSQVTLDLKGTQPVDLIGLRIHVIGSAVSQIGVRAGGSGGQISNVAFDTDPAAGGPNAIDLNANGWTVAHSAIDMKKTNGDCIYTGASGEQIVDSTISGCSVGIGGQGGSFAAQRLHMFGLSIGVDVGSGSGVVEDSLINDANSGLYVAVGASSAILTARQDTIVGRGGGNGVYCSDNLASGASAGTINISDSIISGFSTSIYSYGSAATRTCQVTDTRNDYTAATSPNPPNGTVTSSSAMTADPQFIDPDHGNYRLGPTSTLVNAEPAALPGGQSTTDLDGGLRVIPAGGARDLGAYERPLAQTATTGSAGGVTESSATLAGAANTGGGVGSAVFVYGPTSAYGSQTSDMTLTASVTDQSLADSIGGLAPDATYHYQVVMTTPYGVIKGADATFTTGGAGPPGGPGGPPAVKPDASTGAASGVSATGAMLNGAVNPQSSATSYHFEYGTSIAYGSQTSEQWGGDDLVGHAVSQAVTGLAPNTTYHFRLVATNSAGAAYGADQTFTTLAIKPQNTSAPVISGTPSEGKVLSSSTGGWSGIPAPSLTYQWQRCTPGCVNIPSATGATYTLTSASIGARIRVLVTASNSAGSARAASAGIGPIAAAGPTVNQIRALLLAQLNPTGKPAKIGSLLKKRGYSFSFRTLSAAAVTIRWYYVPKGAKLSRAKKPVLVGSGKASRSAAGSVKLTIWLTSQGKGMLKRVRQLRVTAKATYIRAGKPAVIAIRAFTLKR